MCQFNQAPILDRNFATTTNQRVFFVYRPFYIDKMLKTLHYTKIIKLSFGEIKIKDYLCNVLIINPYIF